jgi:multicomponent Na+:H+ antiporter subunit E
MNLLLLNFILAMGFSAVIGKPTLGGLTAGFVVGYLALWVTKPLYDRPEYFSRVIRVIRLVLHFMYELIVSSVRVARAVITPGYKSRPGIIAVPLDAKTDTEIMLTANLISLTPGTLSLDVSEDRRFLYVHCMFLENVEATKQELKNGIERRVLEALR